MCVLCGPGWGLASGGVGLWEKQLRSPERRLRLLGIRGLSGCKEAVCTKALLWGARHRDVQTRWWSLVGLRGRVGVGVVRAFRDGLRDGDVRVKINAIRGLGVLGTKESLGWIWSLSGDRREIVRVAVCQELARHVGVVMLGRILSCLRERGRLARELTAGELLKPGVKIPLSLRKVARESVGGVLGGRGSRSFSFPAIKFRLKRLKGRLKVYEWTLKRRERLYRHARNARGRRCHEESLRDLRRSRVQFLKESGAYLEKMNGGHFLSARQHLPLAFLASRRARGHYYRGIRCPYTYGYRRRRYIYGRKGIFFRGLPRHVYSKGRNALWVSVRLTHDNFLNALRDDLFAPYVLASSDPAQKEWDFLFSTLFSFSFNLRVDELVFYLFNEIAAHPRARRPEYGGIGDHFILQVSHGRRTKKRKHIFFIKEELFYTPNPPEEEGFPLYFSGPRLVQKAELGGGVSWLDRGRRPWSGDVTLKLSYLNQVEVPFAREEFSSFWAMSMLHRVKASVEKNFSFLGLGVEGSWDVYDFLRVSPQLPAMHFKLRLTLQLGDEQEGLLGSGIVVRGGLGLGLVEPVFSSLVEPEEPMRKQQGVIQPLLSLGFFGEHKRRYSRFGLRWFLLYRRELGPSLRPQMASSVENLLQGELSLGGLRRGSRYSRRGSFHFSVGAWLRYQEYPSVLKNRPEGAFAIITTGLYGKLELQVIRRLRVRISNRLYWISNDFAFVGVGLQLRNIFSVELIFFVF